jgi:hypothetical protein
MLAVRLVGTYQANAIAVATRSASEAQLTARSNLETLAASEDNYDLQRITDDNLWRPTRRADNRQIKREYERDAGPSTATAGYAMPDRRLSAQTRFNSCW